MAGPLRRTITGNDSGEGSLGPPSHTKSPAREGLATSPGQWQKGQALPKKASHCSSTLGRVCSVRLPPSPSPCPGMLPGRNAHSRARKWLFKENSYRGNALLTAQSCQLGDSQLPPPLPLEPIRVSSFWSWLFSVLMLVLLLWCHKPQGKLP